jgi:hypothetical protein
MKGVTLFVTIALALSSARIASAAPDMPWVVGFWTATFDEDGTPADIMEFRADGKYIKYGVNCAVRNEATFHIHSGDVYVTVQVQRKGPVALVFRPSQDRQKLTYTSPRTGNNAIYERLDSKNACARRS